MKKVAILLSLIVSVSAAQLKVPSAYSTIQAGLNAANTGDTVLVAAGTYTENIMWPDVNGIKLISEGDSSNTIIDGGGISSVIYINRSSATIDTTTIIKGFKITNGSNVKLGGGVFCKNVGITIDESLIADNKVVGSGDVDGAGIFAENSIIIIKNSIIRNNIGDPSASSHGGGIRLYRSYFRIENVTFKANSSNQGGGAYISQGSGIIKDTIFKNNSSSLGGGLNASVNIWGGVYSSSLLDNKLYIDNTSIRDNISDGRSGGAHFQGDGQITLNNSTIMNNLAGTSGGGLQIESMKMAIIKNSKIHNNATKVTYGKGGGIYMEYSRIVLENSIIANNSSVSGGGIYFKSTRGGESSTNSISNTQIINNEADEGGGVYLEEYFDVSPTLKNITISNNSNQGIYSSAPLSVSYSNIVNNDFGVYNSTNANILNLANNYWGESSGPYHPSQNPLGQGDSVNAFVNVDPWLTAPNTDAPPIPAQNLKLTASTATSASFSWDASTMSDLAGYKFYYGTDIGGYYYENSVDLGNVVTKSLTGLTTGTKYYIAVTTYDTDGNESWYSKEVSVTMNNTPVIAAVSDVTMNEDESSTVTLSATDVENDAITFSAVSDTNAVTVSVSSATLTLTPNANWHGVANITAYASDGTATDSTSFKLTVTPVDDIAAVQDVTIDEDKSAKVTLTSTFTGTTTFTAVSDTNAVTTSVSSSTLTLTPITNWHGVANIKAYASDGSSKDSTSFKLTITPVQDAPTSFEWVSSALDTINITKTNLADTYTLQWGVSTDAADGDSITYLLYAGTGASPKEEVYDTTSTSLPIPYQEFLQKTFEQIPMLSRATVRFSVYAYDGTDSVKVTGDDRVVFVNRYEYLSTESEGIPTEFALHENYPNPFNPTTTLRFDLPEVTDVTVTIFNMLGQKVKTFNMQSTPAGYHSIKWDATNDYGDPVGAGVYLFQLRANQFVKTKKMVLLK